MVPLLHLQAAYKENKVIVVETFQHIGWWRPFEYRGINNTTKKKEENKVYNLKIPKWMLFVAQWRDIWIQWTMKRYEGGGGKESRYFMYKDEDEEDREWTNNHTNYTN